MSPEQLVAEQDIQLIKDRLFTNGRYEFYSGHRMKMVIYVDPSEIITVAVEVKSTLSAADNAFQYWQECQPVYFHVNNLDQAIENYRERCLLGDPRYGYVKEGTFGVPQKYLPVLQGVYPKDLESHYDYLDLMLEPFWQMVLGKTLDEDNCAGIVVAHGDKFYGYKSQWEYNGVPFNHGALLYLLSRTKGYFPEDYPRSRVANWVIGEYPKFEERILHLESKVFKERFGIH